MYPLALLVAFFSGAWPYIKLLSMILMWFTPSAAVTLFRRGWVLKWLDILGKWSLIDAYVMVSFYCLIMGAICCVVQVGYLRFVVYKVCRAAACVMLL